MGVMQAAAAPMLTTPAHVEQVEAPAKAKVAAPPAAAKAAPRPFQYSHEQMGAVKAMTKTGGSSAPSPAAKTGTPKAKGSSAPEKKKAAGESAKPANAPTTKGSPSSP
jgi:hypothetical protein